MDEQLQSIERIVKKGDKATARRLLRPILTNNPSADAWVLAAQVAESKNQAIDFLRRALELEPQHSAANRELFKLEGAKPTPASKPPIKRINPPPPKEFPKERKLRQTATMRQARRQRRWGRVIFYMTLVMLVSCGVFTLNAIGIIQGLMTSANFVTGGPTPVLAIDDVPIEDIPDAPQIVPAAQSERAQQRDTDVLEHGYLHEYTFSARRGEEVVVYVQFISFSANAVSQNVMILDANDNDIRSACSHDVILRDADNNVIYTCRIQDTSNYRVRILGVNGESTGAYFVGVDRLR